jgi:hypothetical protein
VDVGTPARFAGALQIAPDEVLEAEAEDVIRWEPRHDLEMFVKAVFWRYCLTEYVSILAEKSRAKLLAFWKSWMRLNPWSDLIRAARACDYGGVSKQLQMILPTSPTTSLSL